MCDLVTSRCLQRYLVLISFLWPFVALYLVKTCLRRYFYRRSKALLFYFFRWYLYSTHFSKLFFHAFPLGTLFLFALLAVSQRSCLRFVTSLFVSKYLRSVTGFISVLLFFAFMDFLDLYSLVFPAVFYLFCFTCCIFVCIYTILVCVVLELTRPSTIRVESRLYSKRTKD